MRKHLLLFTFLLFSVCVKAQIPFVSCVDSSMVDIYYTCSFVDYNPVCGCDGVTYRNTCAAEHWGGLITSRNYIQGACGAFDVDFVPNPMVPGSLLNGHGVLSIYVNVGPEYALVQIYDIYGRIWLSEQRTVNTPPPVFTMDIYMDAFPQGIYYVLVIIDGEVQIKKIVKEDID